MEKINKGKFKKGQIPWNKGKKTNQIPWNKGKKNCYSKETIEKFKRNNHPPSRKGIKHSEESKIKNKISNLKLNRIPWNKGLKGYIHSGTITKEKRKYMIIPKKDTSIEIKIQNFLKELKIEFYKHYYIDIKHGYRCDIFIPSLNLIIECDGDYFHGNPILKYKWKNNQKVINQIKLDKIRNKEIKNKNINIIRIWEKDIRKMQPNDLKNIINK